MGSSGGISSRYAIPPWQQPVSMAANMGSTNQRNFPDVAIVGNNILVLYGNGKSETAHGTSCSAPLWAGMTALINEQGAAFGHPPVGFLNPALYDIAQGSNYSDCFNDIITGNNFSNTSTNLFTAVTGYDLCSGWGTPAGQPLIDALEAQDFLVLSPEADTSAFGLVGSPFYPTAQIFSLRNAGPFALN